MKRKNNIMKAICKVPAKVRLQIFAIFTLTVISISVVAIIFTLFSAVSIGILSDTIITLGATTTKMQETLAEIRLQENAILTVQIYCIPVYALSIFSIFLWDGEISKIFRAVVRK